MRALRRLQIVDDHNSRDGFSPLEFADGQAGGSDENYAARVVISAVMIGIGFLAAMIALIATLLVDQMLILSDPAYPLQSSGDQMHAEQRSNATLVSIGLMKLFLGLGVLGLSAFVEYEHEKESNDICPKCIKIALEHISAMLAVTSSATDILSSRRGRARQTELLHKVKENALEFHVALGAAVVAAVWCLKTVDHNMVPFYKNDLKYFYRDKDLTGLLSSSSRYITVIAHGVLIGCFASLMALCVLGLLNLSWRGEFLGGDLLWLVVLFVSTAILGSSNQRSTLTAQLVMNIVCVGIAAEKLCASINAIYQFSTYPVFVHGADDVYDAQIVLISVLAAEVLTALCCCVLLGKQLSLQRSYFETQSPTCLAIAFSISTLFYGVVMTGCYVVFELGKWRYNEVPLEIAFFRIANGPLALAAFIVQILCCCCPWLLVVSVILQTIVGSLALFTISLSTTNVYYMVPGQLMEEQTVYVATDENPFYYHTSKRFYRQPYKIESG
ncbi:unnamed protein product [Heligmosomoides polygyrus]|uniref:Transmembrane protein n=1 Tax=Heligmosomoides polygyrus TaxID=6339 RepID=A0A3P8BSM3_HELPZ|nr:unnamed protein product [Heligmosomoides polygyrus]